MASSYSLHAPCIPASSSSTTSSQIFPLSTKSQVGSSSSSSSSSSQEPPYIMRGGHGPTSSSDGFSAFVTARSLLPSDGSLSRDTTLSPGFRSAAAMAGWDDESLLMAALQEEDNCLPVGLIVEEEEEERKKEKEQKKENTDMQEMSPIFVKKVSQIDSIRNARDRKRDQRTPQQAATPLSAGRRCLEKNIY